MKKLGFCKQCLRNVPHVLYFQWPVFRLLNRYLEFANTLPLASWHCCGCEKNSFRIFRPDSEVPTDVTSTSMDDLVEWPDPTDRSQRFGLLFHRKRNTKVLEPSKAGSAAKEKETVVEHVGNITRSDDSLLVRKARASRYSRKFREGVVDKILSGGATISQIRSELGLSERDLLDWINDRVMRQDQHISKLTRVVDAVKHLTDEATPAGPRHDVHLKIHQQEHVAGSHLDSGRHKGPTIDGRVNPR